MSTFKNKNSLTTIEAQIAQKLKNNEARPKFTGSYKKKKTRVYQVKCFLGGTLMFVCFACAFLFTFSCVPYSCKN